MFGYVRVFQPELKMGEFEQYRGVYCSLCKQLGKRYGILSRFTLSYDFTFLALFCMSMESGCAGFHKSRCLFNPLKKKTCCSANRQIEFAADVATLMMYYKVKDNIADSGFWASLPARAMLPFAAHARKKAAKKYPDLDELMNECMKQQSDLESRNTASIDAAADPSARMLSELAAYGEQDEQKREILLRFGYCLGRWIYLIDAVDDLENDLHTGSYNPYIVSQGLNQLKEEEISGALKETREYSLLTLNACLAECLRSYDSLEIQRFDGILKNILEMGMPSVQQKVITQCKEK